MTCQPTIGHQEMALAKGSKANMRILRVIHSMSAASGGPAEALRQSSRLHQSWGHETEVASLDLPDDEARDKQLIVHRLGEKRSTYSYSSHLVPWLQENVARFDAIIVHGIWQYHSFATWRVCRRSKIPYFVFPHGMLDPWFKKTYPLKHLKKWLYWPWAEYRVLRDATGVLFTCEQERQLARESFWLYRCREQVVQYGTTGPRGDREEQRRQIFARFPELEGKRILLFLGRIHPKKGCDLLIQAFGALLSKESAEGHDAWRLVIAGPCADPIYLEGLAKLAARCCPPGTVSFPGLLSGEAKWGALHAADAFVLPSHQENFGVAVAEALACGLPVLISDKVNIWREIDQNGAGLIEADDEEGTARLLKRWVALPIAAREKMGANARACFETLFEIEKAAKSLLDVLGGRAAR